MALKDVEISVVGGGVAGLAAARALALRGARVTVFERAAEIAEVGAGLQVSPNGLKVLDALGLGSAIRSVSMKGEMVALTDGPSGRAVLRLDLARAAGDYLFVHRARMIGVLEAGAIDAGVRIELGREICPGDLDGLVVAADGVRSVHRAVLNGGTKARFAHQVAWRAVIEDAGAAPVAQVFMGPGRHLVTYPLAGGLRNIVAVEERDGWVDEGWHNVSDPSLLRSAFEGFGGPVPEWLGAVEDVHLWGLFLHPVAERWHDDRTALVGDAAHPMLPFLAQGANMALEDAWVLAACLDRAAGADGLAAFQKLRRDRVVRVVAAAAANARNYHLREPLKTLAHSALRLGVAVRPDWAMRRFDWLYGYDATRAFG